MGCSLSDWAYSVEYAEDGSSEALVKAARVRARHDGRKPIIIEDGRPEKKRKTRFFFHVCRAI